MAKILKYKDENRKSALQKIRKKIMVINHPHHAASKETEKFAFLQCNV